MFVDLRNEPDNRLREMPLATATIAAGGYGCSMGYGYGRLGLAWPNFAASDHTWSARRPVTGG
jgi:hypothetical protein